MRDTSLKDPDLTLNELLRQARFEWHGVRLGQPDWGDASHSIALTVWSLTGRIVFHFMINAWRERLSFELPLPGKQFGGSWRRWLDTSFDSPADIVPLVEAPAVSGKSYELPPHSLAVLLARAATGRAER